MRSFASRTTNTISPSKDFWRGGTGAEAVPPKPDTEGKRVYTKLFDLQRITGYSWTRIAELMSCSRQSIHNWQRGEALSERSIRDIARWTSTSSPDRSDLRRLHITVKRGERNFIQKIEAEKGC
jgi:hypothetical protein